MCLGIKYHPKMLSFCSANVYKLQIDIFTHETQLQTLIFTSVLFALLAHLNVYFLLLHPTLNTFLISLLSVHTRQISPVAIHVCHCLGPTLLGTYPAFRRLLEVH
jgi:hypothetical protein